MKTTNKPQKISFIKQGFYLTLGFVVVGLSLALTAFAQVALEIKNVNTQVVGDDVTVAWETNNPSTGRVDYGENDIYDRSRSTNKIDWQQKILLENLKPKTNYHFKITATGSVQTASTFDITFKTGESKSIVTPLITQASVVYVTATTATIQWHTDKETDSLIRYGTTASYNKNASNRGRVLDHDITLGRLNPSTTYHFQIVAKDKDGNTATYIDRTFTTLDAKNAENENVILSNIKPLSPGDTNITATNVTVSWNSNHLGSPAVYYGTDATRLRSSVKPNKLRSFAHSIEITKLKPSTRYYFQVETRDVFGKTKRSDTYSFITKEQPVVYSPGNEAPEVLGYEAQAPTKTEKLYRDASTAKVYAIKRGSKTYIPNVASFNRAGYKWKDVITVPSRTLANMPEGRLVRSTDDPTVYYLYQRSDGYRKLAIPASIFTSYPNNRWERVITMGDKELAAIPESKLIKATGDPSVYVLENGRKRALSSETIFTSRGYRWSDVVDVNAEHLDYYPTGLPL